MLLFVISEWVDPHICSTSYYVIKHKIKVFQGKAPRKQLTEILNSQTN